MRALSLFSGYGGIDLALKEYITEVIAYVEIEEYPQKIIAYRMADGSLPRAPILGDVKNVEGEIGDCDIIYGGFPCQDISVAGNGKGLEGERSGLFFEIIRLTKEIRPSFVFLENVPAIRTRGLEQVIKAFAEVGYDCRWTCLSAASVGANHKRERWFLLAYSNSVSLRNKQKREQRFKGTPVTRYDGTEKYLANSESERLETKQNGLSGVEAKQSMSSSCGARDESWWSTEPNVGRVVNGTPFRVDRIKAIGNGVVPLQVKTAFELLIGINPAPSAEKD